MQFPLRDFFWLTIVIGLTIGIAIEHKRVRDLSGYQGQAEWWEKAARGLGEKFEQQTGQPVEFDERKSIAIMSHAEGKDVRVGPTKTLVQNAKPWVAHSIVPVYVRDTREPNMSLVTGLIDLDIYLTIIVLGGPILAINYIRRKKPLPLGIGDPNAPIWKHPWPVLLIIPSHVGMSIFAYTALRSPFSGTLFLFGSVIWTYFYCQFVLGRQRQQGPENTSGVFSGRLTTPLE